MAVIVFVSPGAIVPRFHVTKLPEAVPAGIVKKRKERS
jgi:hypothetical protein